MSPASSLSRIANFVLIERAIAEKENQERNTEISNHQEDDVTIAHDIVNAIEEPLRKTDWQLQHHQVLPRAHTEMRIKTPPQNNTTRNANSKSSLFSHAVSFVDCCRLAGENTSSQEVANRCAPVPFRGRKN
jgi:hypothetical protein